MKPKKFTVIGNDGRAYVLVAKKEDLKKDSRLMDLDAILNKLLRKDSDSRRRQLSEYTSMCSLGSLSLTSTCQRSAPSR